jgi:F0F1-type ATP synthase assembly protein I
MENEYDPKDRQKEKDEAFYQVDEHPEPMAETTRKSGLAYSAVIMLVASILVFLGIGWALDKFFNTAPWLLVSGIILGAIIGFYQFIRISAQLN